MNIISAQYKTRDTYDDEGNVISTENCAVIAVINGETFGVPLDPANRHYAEIIRQVDAGELTIADAE
jgi:hypothetical protein